MDFVKIELEKLDLSDEELLKYILDLGVDVNFIQIKNRHLIFYLIARKKFDLIDKLKGINLDMKDSYRTFTPLHSACWARNFKGVKFLLNRGVNINSTSESGNTPLHFCCANSDIKLTSLLLEKGAEVNLKNYLGSSILLYACRYGSLKMVELLLERGAKIEYENGKLVCLEGKENKSIEELFLKYQMRRKKGIPRKE